jgi:hypothetical protein
VDQVIARGSPVSELSLNNVDDVDYITAGKSDYDYSVDVNPFDGVQVDEHRVSFYGHVMRTPADWREVGKMIFSLVVENR